MKRLRIVTPLGPTTKCSAIDRPPGSFAIPVLFACELAATNPRCGQMLSQLGIAAVLNGFVVKRHSASYFSKITLSCRQTI